jgi:hypothetical protein
MTKSVNFHHSGGIFSTQGAFSSIREQKANFFRGQKLGGICSKSGGTNNFHRSERVYFRARPGHFLIFIQHIFFLFSSYKHIFIRKQNSAGAPG